MKEEFGCCSPTDSTKFLNQDTAVDVFCWLDFLPIFPWTGTVSFCLSFLYFLNAWSVSPKIWIVAFLQSSLLLTMKIQVCEIFLACLNNETRYCLASSFDLLFCKFWSSSILAGVHWWRHFFWQQLWSILNDES